MLLYYGLANYLGNGQTPGKWFARTRAGLTDARAHGILAVVERALGYGAAILEGGLGFAQYFWQPNRMSRKIDSPRPSSWMNERLRSATRR